jgi:hypothetical protein
MALISNPSFNIMSIIFPTFLDYIMCGFIMQQVQLFNRAVFLSFDLSLNKNSSSLYAL